MPFDGGGGRSCPTKDFQRASRYTYTVAGVAGAGQPRGLRRCVRGVERLGSMTLIIDLPLELERRLEEEAARNGQAVQDYARTVLAKQLEQPPVTEIPAEGKATVRPTGEVAAETVQDVPAADLQGLPSRLAGNPG